MCVLTVVTLVEAGNLDIPQSSSPNDATKVGKAKKTPFMFQVFRFVVILGFIAVGAIIHIRRKRGREQFMILHP